MDSNYYTVEDIRNVLRFQIEVAGTQSALADEIGISAAYLSDVLAGHRCPGPLILRHLKLEQVVVYVEQKIDPNPS